MRQCVATAPVSSRTSFFRFCFVCLSSLVLLLATMFSQSSQATDAASAEETATLTWPLLPGENLNQLARLFYPNDRAMQAVFIRQTLALSRDLHPQLQADQRFDQITSIVIPELKALSRHASPPARKPGALQMTRQMGEESIAIVTEAMWQQYQTLEQNHQQLNSALESLHDRLDRLQRTVQEVTDAARKAMQTPAADKPAITNPAGAEPANGKAATPQTRVATTDIPDTQAATGNKVLAIILASWRHIAAIASLLLFGLLMFWILRRKRQQIAMNNEQFTQWLNTVQPNIAPEPSLLKPSGLLNEAKFEINDALQQARILVGSGKPKSAIQLLDRAVNAETPQPLETWLYLLDLCREAALKTEFENYAQKLHQHFNVMTPQWEKVEVPLVVASSLEEFPHISEQLVKHWQNGSADVYLQSLLTDNRGGERAGFGPEVMQEILLLQGLLKNRE